MAPKVKEVKATLGTPQRKGKVTRYDDPAENPSVLSNIYPTNAAMDKLGNPEKIEVIIRVAK